MGPRTQFLTQPEVRTKRVFDIKAISLGRIEVEVKAQFNDEQGMLYQKAPQPGRVGKPFTEADQQGLEIGAFRMGWSPPSECWACQSSTTCQSSPTEGGPFGII